MFNEGSLASTINGISGVEIISPMNIVKPLFWNISFFIWCWKHCRTELSHNQLSIEYMLYKTSVISVLVLDPNMLWWSFEENLKIYYIYWWCYQFGNSMLVFLSKIIPKYLIYKVVSSETAYYCLIFRHSKTFHHILFCNFVHCFISWEISCSFLVLTVYTQNSSTYWITV